MKNKLNINPTGLKGQEVINEMKRLMGIKPLTENVNERSKIELTKKGPDGKTYGIVRENHEFYIKVTDKTEKVLTEDFKYIGGLGNKKDQAYDSYAKAIKHLNLKFISLKEALGKSDKINVFENDNILENAIGATGGGAAFGFVQEVKEEEKEICEEEVELSENEKAIMEMNDKEYGLEEVADVKNKGKFSISDAIDGDKMDETIESSTVNEDKINNLLKTLNESEKNKLIESLKKKI